MKADSQKIKGYEFSGSDEIDQSKEGVTKHSKELQIELQSKVVNGKAVEQLQNIGPQCVQNRRSIGSSRKESKRGVHDCTFDNIQVSVTVSYSKSA